MFKGRPPKGVIYQTKFGRMFGGLAEDVLASDYLTRQHGRVDLILTSPPFPLVRKKLYGNLTGEKYIEWIGGFGKLFSQLLSDSGSLVIEMGNAWESRRPVMSTVPIMGLLKLVEEGGFKLCQELIWHNPARLPSPAQWVNVERIRLKDSFTRLWWLSKTDWPKANNRNVLVEYSQHMKSLLQNGKYNAGGRPSEHSIGKSSFLTDHGGAIPPSVLSFSNTSSNDQYLRACKLKGLKPHPARMPLKLAEFFIKFLTEKGDLVLDPFAGSNVTGQAAEALERNWLSIEKDSAYIDSSLLRFR